MVPHVLFQNEETALMKACSWDGWRFDAQTNAKRVRLETNCADYTAIVKMLLAHPGTMVNMQDNVRFSYCISHIIMY